MKRRKHRPHAHEVPGHPRRVHWTGQPHYARIRADFGFRVEVGEPHPGRVSKRFEVFDDGWYWAAGARAQVEDFRRLASMKNCRDQLRPSLHQPRPQSIAGCEVCCLGIAKKLWKPPLIAELKQRSEEHTSELQSLRHLVCRLLLE